MKNGLFLLLPALLFPASCFGQGFADVPAAPATAAAPLSFDLAPPAPAEAAPLAAANIANNTTNNPAPLTKETPAAPLPKRTPTASPMKQPPPEMLRSRIAEDHPFVRFMELPKDPQSPIKGTPLTVAQLLRGTYSPALRCQLLESYWELLGLLAEYNVRRESEQLAASVRDAQQAQALNLFQQQRRSTEMEFVKKQWEFAELLKRSKGMNVSENTLPLPCDAPVFKPYETYAAQIARSETAKYLARLLPIQQQLVDAKHKSCEAIFQLSSAVPANSQQLVAQLNQRTEAFLELRQAVVEYNQMIARYTAQTVGPNVSQYQLVGAVIELPKFSPQQQNSIQNPEQPVNRSTATNPAPPRLSALPLPLPEKKEEPVAEPAALTAAELPSEPPTAPPPISPAVAAAKTFDKTTDNPLRTVAALKEFPEAEPARAAEQIASEFAAPPKPLKRAGLKAPEAPAEKAMDFSMFADEKESEPQSAVPPQPQRERPIRQTVPNGNL